MVLILYAYHEYRIHLYVYTICLLMRYPYTTYKHTHVNIGCKHEEGDNRSDYRMWYPTTDGGFCVDSLEYGNAMRFINHSSGNRANCTIKYVYLDGLTHCIIVS